MSKPTFHRPQNPTKRRGYREALRAAAAVLFLLVLGLAAWGISSFASTAREARRTSELRSAYGTLRYAVALERKVAAEGLRRRRVDGRAFVGASRKAIEALRDGRANAGPIDRARLLRLSAAHTRALTLTARMGAALAQGDLRRAHRLAGPADLDLAQVASGAGAGAGDRRLRDAGRWPTSRADFVQFAAVGLVFLFGLGSAVLPLVGLVGYRRRADTERQAELRRLELAALTDSLTGLRNHRAFHEDLTREISRRNRTGSCFSLVIVDLNGLKQVNDSLGHQAGDERINAVAECLQATVRDADGAYRIGGDEFAIIAPEERAWGALNLANRLHAEVAKRNGFVRVTVGVTESTGTEAKDSVIRHADLALYEAKRSHLGTIVYSPGLEPRNVPSADDAQREHQRLLASALARAVDAKDAGARNHCETVSELCVMVGQKLGLAPDRLEKLRLAGLLHDVGKIGIADAILQKPERLGREESRVMKTHSSIGHNIVAAAGLGEEAKWVLHHHEWFDGGGYPDGLAAGAIPLESRIILVADAFEAITGDRPYRLARPPAEAIEELVAHAGDQFDPGCVAALCAVFGHEPSIPLEAVADELAPRRRARPDDDRAASAAAGA